MKQIFNSIIPFKGFLAINLFGVLFIRKEYKDYVKNNKKAIYMVNHESIHTKQMIELGYVFFYIIYLLEWIYRLLFTKDRFSNNAYRNISFEQEAYNNEKNLKYLKERKHFAQWRKIKLNKI